MRWIILLLLLMNTGYFAWETYQQSLSRYAKPVVSEPEKPQGKRLVLWSESGRNLPKSDLLPEPVERSEHSEPEAARNTQCLVVGPFDSSAKADEMQQRLFSLGVTSSERSDNEANSYDHWVHIPPLAGRDAAIRLLRELQGQGIDSFVITQGELANGISLGLFSKEASANKVSSRLLAAGYETRIKRLARQPQTYWLELAAKQADKVTDAMWENFANEYNGLKVLEKSCKGIATEPSIH